ANQKVKAEAIYLSTNPRSTAGSIRMPASKTALYNSIIDQGGSFSCRDILCRDMLELNGVKGSTIIGDPALFDSNLIGTPLKVPPKTPRVAVTVPHMHEYKNQTISLLTGLIGRFGTDNVILSLHAAPTKAHESEI